MKQRKYFEIFAQVGRPAVPDKDFPYREADLLDDMAYARIHGAAILHHAARDFSFTYGNGEAMKIARENPRLVALAMVPPSAAFETGNPRYFDDLLDGGVCGFVLMGDEISPTLLEPLCAALIRHNRPLIIINCHPAERLLSIGVLAQAFPSLNIIMYGVHWGAARVLTRMMECHPNLYFDFSSYQLNDILEMTKAHFGIERVLYSGAWPRRAPGAMKCMVEYADLTEEEKDLVAYGNACRLFGLSPDDFALYDDADCALDEIAREADAGSPVSVPVIDAHTHIVGSGDAVNNLMVGATPAAMAKKMERMGVDTTVTAPWIGISYDGIAGNEEVIAAAKKYPGKFLGFSTCNVNYPEDRKEVIRFHEENPDLFVGIKPYPPYHKFRHTDEICAEWYAYANEHHLTALIHTACDDFAEQVDEMASRYPNVTFIMAHTGADYFNARKNIAVAKKHPNVVLDITYTTVTRGMIEFLVSEVGADRVLYGSDAPMRDPAPQLGWVCYARICAEDKKKILAGNFQRLLAQRV